uniref:DNA mismatch repair protein MutS core domain-containing protein n=1 Tax=Panagrolaimus superbus TaxID=310955 RepID=A0A914Z3G0_9BILA
MSNIYLALSYKNFHLGAAFYDEESEAIHILNDIAEDEDFSSLSNLIHEVQPAFVIASLSQDSNFLKKLRRLCNFNVPDATRQDDSDVEEPPEEEQFDITFGYETTQRSVANDELNDGSEIPVFNAHLIGKKANNNASNIQKSSSSNILKNDSKSSATKNSSNVNDDDDDDENDEEKIYAVLTLLPHLTFEEGDAKKRIKSLFSSETVSSDLMASFRFDFDSTNMVRALGALLRYLDQQRIGVEFDEITKKTPISAFNTVTLDDAVEIDKTTFKALQVFESEYVPSAVKRRPGILTSMKNGVSLFSLLNICRSVPGKRLMKRWFERPIFDRTILRERQSAVSFFYQDCNLDATKFIRTKMKDVANVRPILRRLRNGSASVGDWINLYNTSYSMIEIVDFITEREINLKILKGKFKFYNDLYQLAAVISEVMDFQESKGENRFVVKNGVDDELDLLKEKYADLPHRLTLIAKNEADLLDIDTCSVAYVPIIGFLLVVSENARISPRMASKLDLIYTADGEANYKSPKMKVLDQEIGDIKMQIIDAETSTVLRLQSLVLKRSTSLCKSVDAAATLDCLMSFALVGRELNWHRPNLVDEAIIDIGMARHPLSEITCPFTFVPNPIKSGGPFTKAKLISGPNASGKSVCYWAN